MANVAPILQSKADFSKSFAVFTSTHSRSKKEETSFVFPNQHFTELLLEQIKPYDGNPRTTENAMKDEIKTSIKAAGMNVPLCVTKRPGDTEYIPQAGGNTRLQILNELYRETGDERFHKVIVMIVPWIDESHVLVGHLTENILRGEMCFADTTSAIIRMKAHIDASEPRAIRWGEFEQRLDELGFRVSHTQLSRMRFFDKYLSDILPEDIRIQFGPHHVQKLMTALKNTRYIEDDYRDTLCDILVRHGIDIDGAIKEITHPTKLDIDQNNTEPSPLELLQTILDLRRDNYRIITDMTCSLHFKEANDNFGFQVKKYIPKKAESVAVLLSRLSIKSMDISISMMMFCALNKPDLSATLRIIANIRSMYLAEASYKKDGGNDVIHMTNDEIEHMQDELSPKAASEKQLIKEYIKHEATSLMLKSLFPNVDVARIREMRTRIIGKDEGGRPIMALPDEAWRIWTLWKKQKKMDERECYLVIAKKLHLPLGMVWNTIKSRISNIEDMT